MTTVLTMLAGALLGGAIAGTGAAVKLTRYYRGRLEEAGWRADVDPDAKVGALPSREVRRLHRRADSAERRATRYERAVTELQAIHKLVVADLVDTVHDRDRTIAALRRRLRPARRSPVPTYGRWRAA